MNLKSNTARYSTDKVTSNNSREIQQNSGKKLMPSTIGFNKYECSFDKLVQMTYISVETVYVQNMVTKAKA